jgi:hypothetical protein
MLPRAVSRSLLGALERPPLLQRRAIAAINRHRVPPALQEELLSRVNAYAASRAVRDRRELARWLGRYSGRG